MSGEWHEYSEDNNSSCKKCKDLYDDNKDEDAQVDDYHEIDPIKKGKKRGMTATLDDFKRGAKLRLNKDYKGNSQLGAFDLDTDSDDDDVKKKTTSSPVTSSPKTTSSPKKNTVSKGGRRRKRSHTKKRRSYTKKRKSHSKRRKSHKK